MKELVMTLKDGKEVKYEIIVSFHLFSTGKDYVVYTDNSKNEQWDLNTYALIYYPDDESKFEEIKTDEEWDAVSNMLEKLKQQDGGIVNE